uniref:NADH-quinone oxidoreductase subunit D domain-containing protein n=1 Tax=Lactuca sativa TaxID=4236 RepID=A0A9R1UVX9_LACSA|nr:hypothetical protein LSAT_V11C700369010 [Lactuca sativa]
MSPWTRRVQARTRVQNRDPTRRWWAYPSQPGVCWDSQRVARYFVHDQSDPDVPVGTRGDRYDRYCIRTEEMQQSVRIIVQCPNQMPSGMIKADDRKLCPPSRYRMKLSIESCANQVTSPFFIDLGGQGTVYQLGS